MVFDMHEHLQMKFGELYCAAYLVHRIEHSIDQYIRSKLGEEISNKIETIGVDIDYDDFMVLTIFVSNRYWKTVFRKVKEVFPGWDWYTEKNTNFSDIYLRLDDDVIAGVPQFLWEE